MNLKLAAVASSILLMTGCGSLDWKSEYACPGMPSGVVCKSPVEVYKMTEKTDRVINEEGESAQKARDRMTSAAGEAALSQVPSQVTTGRNLPREAQPILEPAKVVRIWIAPWIDSAQDLHMPGYVFTEVTPRRWSFGEASATRSKPLVPIQSDMNGHMGGEESDVEVDGETKLLTPKGLVQGMQQMQQGGGRQMAPGMGPGAMPGQGGRMPTGPGAQGNANGAFGWGGGQGW